MMTAYFASAVGLLEFIAKDNCLIRVKFLPDQPFPSSSWTPPSSAFFREAVVQFASYFEGKQKKIDLPFLIEKATSFQAKVWRLLQQIPYGETSTYGELAKILETSPRAIGRACRENPLPLVIPCHRVVAKVGLGGFVGKTSGDFFFIKQKLLNFEAVKGVPCSVENV